MAVRAVFDTREALGDFPIIGVGGVASAEDAVQFFLAGATAIQIGTATFADPRAPARILRDLGRWCDRRGVAGLDELIGAAHG